MGRGRRMARFKYTGVTALAVAGVVVGAAMVGGGSGNGAPAAAVAGRATGAASAAHPGTHERWTQRVDGSTALAGAKLAGDGARFDPIRRRLLRDGGGHSPGAASEGSAEFPVHRLAHPAGKVTVTLDSKLPPGSDATAEVRGRAGDGFWTEWTPVSPGGTVKLPRPADTVQVRAVMTPGVRGARPSVRAVSVTTTAARKPLRKPKNHAAYSARIFATREGLVGRTTANGYTIRAKDHFVALPSRRALSSKGGGGYTVRVCAHKRCDYAPVWDVGPWNIRDNHWHKPRDQWKKLKLGLPQAQAAYQKGFNHGRDGLGRRVLNPAGIDLADGTARESLRVNDGGWVRVTYVWTGVYSRTATIHARKKWRKASLYRGPSRKSAFVGYAVDGVRVGVNCQAKGPAAIGRYGVSHLWDRIGPHTYIPHAYIGRDDKRTLRACRPGE